MFSGSRAMGDLCEFLGIFQDPKSIADYGRSYTEAEIEEMIAQKLGVDVEEMRQQKQKQIEEGLELARLFGAAARRAEERIILECLSNYHA